MKAAQDSHGRVRVAAATSASHLSPKEGLPIVNAVIKTGIGKDYEGSLNFAKSALEQSNEPFVEEKHRIKVPEHLSLAEGRLYTKGAEIYEKEGYCGTCHQENGLGLPDSGFPPLADTNWVNGDHKRLIKTYP